MDLFANTQLPDGMLVYTLVIIISLGYMTIDSLGLAEPRGLVVTSFIRTPLRSPPGPPKPRLPRGCLPRLSSPLVYLGRISLNANPTPKRSLLACMLTFRDLPSFWTSQGSQVPGLDCALQLFLCSVPSTVAFSYCLTTFADTPVYCEPRTSYDAHAGARQGRLSASPATRSHRLRMHRHGNSRPF